MGYPRRRTCGVTGVAISTMVNLIHWLKIPQVFPFKVAVIHKIVAWQSSSSQALWSEFGSTVSGPDQFLNLFFQGGLTPFAPVRLRNNMSRKVQQIKVDPSLHGSGSSGKSSPILSVSSLSASAVRKEHSTARNQFPAKRMRVIPGVTITHLEAIGDNSQGIEAPQWFYPAVNQMLAPIFSRLTDLEQRIADLDARNLDLEARFSDHKTIYIARFASCLHFY